MLYPLVALSAGAVVLASSQSLRADDQPAPPAFSIAGFEFVGDDATSLQLGAGVFNVVNNAETEGHDGRSAEGRLELRLGEKFYSIGPLLGLMANSDGGVFGYGGLYTDIRIGSWIVTPSGGLGGYAEGDSRDLGGIFQFHLGLDVAYQFDNGSRLGAKFAHISNAWIHDSNPGVESVLLTYSIPLGRVEF